MILYHGTNSIITEFATDFIGSGTGNYQFGPGIYFTNDIDLAKKYGKNIYEVKCVKARLRKAESKVPRWEFIGGKIKKATNWREAVQNWDENVSVGFRLALEAMENSKDFGDCIQQIWADFYMNEDKKFCEEMSRSVIDGIVYTRGISQNEDTGINRVIVTLFNTAAIKHARLIS